MGQKKVENNWFKKFSRDQVIGFVEQDHPCRLKDLMDSEIVSSSRNHSREFEDLA